MGLLPRSLSLQGELGQARRRLEASAPSRPTWTFLEGKRLSPETDPHARSPHAPTPPRFPAGPSALAATGALALLTAAAVTGLTPASSSASSHREAPLIAGDPRADNTDVYAFTSPDKPETVTLVANWHPFQEPNGGPNFYPFAEDARYNIKIDADGNGSRTRPTRGSSPTTSATTPTSSLQHRRREVGQRRDPELPRQT